ncbi:hypothetical protein [Kocuria oceani]|uniref:Uncharacterized protein n=1 Tax=Kocuria oceani TaxID=988827 RepID=A0ABV9TPP9_9MICC|nr:hypothetical protein [Kocuria oceani]
MVLSSWIELLCWMSRATVLASLSGTTSRYSSTPSSSVSSNV